MNQAEIRAMWLARVEDFRASGQTVKQWCEHNNFRPGRLHYWLRKFRASGKSELSISWLPLEVEETIPDTFLALKIGRYNIEVKPGFDREHLRELILTLEQLC